MLKNRVLFIGVWLFCIIALWVLPGFEARGLMFGLIVGYIPFILLTFLGIIPEHHHPLAVILTMLFFSFAFVFLSAWLMDKTRLFKGYAILLSGLILFLPCLGFRGSSYENWERSPDVQQRTASSEISYVPNRSDYNKQIAIPGAIAGAVLGLYIACFTGGIASVIILLKRKNSDSKP